MILTDTFVAVVPGYRLIPAVPGTVRLQSVFKHQEIPVIIVRLDGVCLLIKTYEVSSHQFFRRQFCIIKKLRRRGFVVDCLVLIYLRDKRYLHFLWLVNLVVLAGNLRWLLLHQDIHTIRQHNTLAPVIVLPAATAGMECFKVLIHIIAGIVPLHGKQFPKLRIFFKKGFVIIESIFYLF